MIVGDRQYWRHLQMPPKPYWTVIPDNYLLIGALSGDYDCDDCEYGLSYLHYQVVREQL